MTETTTENTETPRRTRRMDAPIGPGDAADRVIALIEGLPEAEQRAIDVLRADVFKRAAAIVDRVPEEKRERARAMIVAAGIMLENPGPDLPSPRGAEGEPLDVEFDEVETAEPNPNPPLCIVGGCLSVATMGDFCAQCAAAAEADEAKARPPVETWTDEDFEANGWKKMPDGQWAPERLAAQVPEPLPPGAITEVDESKKPQKRQREARRA